MKHCTLFLFIVLATSLITLSSCSSTKTVSVPVTPIALEKGERDLPELMVGSFDSSLQAKEDSNYYDITLRMVPIWPDEPDTYLYVEQSVSTMQDKPYRQRVYKVVQLLDGSYRSEVYTMADDSLMVGKWNKPSFFDTYSPSDLIEREGCAVYMMRTGREQWKGRTSESDCKSTLRGASYATSLVEIAPGTISSWDQGFDDGGVQVWGAVDGPYIFKRMRRIKGTQRQVRMK